MIFGLILTCHNLLARETLNSDQKFQSVSQIAIDRIDFVGVTAFTSEALQNVLEINPGDRINRLKIINTEENILRIYKSRGYEEAKISTRLVRKKNPDLTLENTLEFKIFEGAPIRVRSVEFFSGQNTTEGSQKFIHTHLDALKKNLDFHAGDVLDQEKIALGKRSIQELLASEKYIGGQVQHVDIESAPAPPDLLESSNITQGDVHPSTLKWVKLRVDLDIGDRVTFGFRGNTLFSTGYLANLVDEQRTLGLGKDYVNVVKDRILAEYQGSGYGFAEIQTYSVESTQAGERHISFLIQEGPKIQIESIDFDGFNQFSEEQLRKQFFKKASSFIQNRVYVEKDAQKAAQLLIEWMKEQGHLSARLVTVHTTYLDQKVPYVNTRSIKLLIYLYEGDQTLVRKISFNGLTLLNAKQIQDILKLKTDQPLNLFDFNDGLEHLKTIYRDRGYLDFKILNEGTESVIQYSQDNRIADIELQLDEGLQYKVGQINIEGLEFTKEIVVRQEIELKPGEILKESDLIQTELKLKKLGIFSTVHIRIVDDPVQPGTKDIWIKVSEADRGTLSWAPGVRNDLGVRLSSQFLYSNLWGSNHSLSLLWNINRRFYLYNFVETQAQLAYTWPWFAFPGVTFRPALTFSKTQYYNFAANNIALSSLWEKQLLRNPNLTTSLSYSLEYINQFNAVLATDNSQLRLGTITPKISLDLRDNPMTPKTGALFMAWLDLSTPGMGTGNPYSFYRAQFRSDYYIPLPRDIRFFFSFRSGFEQSFSPNTNGQDAIPLIKQFALGGIGSLRGWQELEFSKPQTLTMTRNMSYINYRTQIDFPVSGGLLFGLFVDAANLMIDNHALDGLVYGPGFGFHYLTPLGAVNFDVGFKVNPPPGIETYVTHFSLGVI